MPPHLPMTHYLLLTWILAGSPVYTLISQPSAQVCEVERVKLATKTQIAECFSFKTPPDPAGQLRRGVRKST